MNVLIRVDAYDEIALGHLSRCIELTTCFNTLFRTTNCITLYSMILFMGIVEFNTTKIEVG